LLGLTSGAIRIDNYQEQELSGRTRKIMSMDIAVMEVLMKAPKMRTMVLKEYMR
jgi:hypothetical protein